MTAAAPARKDLPPMDAMVANIIGTYRDATDDDVARGAAWYGVARDFSAELAGRYGLTLELAAGIVAVLSAGTEWTENVRAAELVCQAWQESHDVQRVHDVAAVISSRSGGQNCRRAARLLSTGSTTDVERTVRTLKVWNFWRSILGELDRVCVDSHATRVALGTIADPQYAVGPSTDAAYADLATAYRKAAAELGEDPAVLQAITWVACKRQRDALKATWRTQQGAF